MNKMLELQLEHQKHLLFLTFVGIMIYLVVLVYLIRLFMARQLKKDAIKDFESSLFNRKYFDAILAFSVSVANRKKQPLSLMCIDLSAITKVEKSPQKRSEKLFDFAEDIKKFTRNSDIGSRIDDNTAMLLLQDTDAEQAGILAKRLKENLVFKYNFVTSLVVFQLEIGEQSEDFMERISNACSVKKK